VFVYLNCSLALFQPRRRTRASEKEEDEEIQQLIEAEEGESEEEGDPEAQTCSLCLDSESKDPNPLITCANCGILFLFFFFLVHSPPFILFCSAVCVHQQCYGVNRPSRKWVCERCANGFEDTVGLSASSFPICTAGFHLLFLSLEMRDLPQHRRHFQANSPKWRSVCFEFFRFLLVLSANLLFFSFFVSDKFSGEFVHANCALWHPELTFTGANMTGVTGFTLLQKKGSPVRVLFFMLHLLFSVLNSRLASEMCRLLENVGLPSSL
jgi:hypothetical protein